MDFVFAKLLFTVRLENSTSDIYSFFGIKNSFMKAFREAVCSRDALCESCPDRDSCSYSLTFSQGLSVDPAALKRHQKPSLPFVFNPPVLPAPPNCGCEVEIGLVLAGSAINHVRDYLSAVSLLFGPGNRGWGLDARIVKAETVTCAGYRSSILDKTGKMDSDTISTISARDLEETGTLGQEHIRLELVTPARLLQDGKPVRDFSFSSFVRPLMRRLSSLSYYYYGGGMEFDYKWLSEASMSVKLAENDFHWREWSGDRICGIVGSGVCEGPLADFHTLLLLGEYFNVGKGAPFGLGRYRLEKQS